MPTFDIAIIGGGILGLATARELLVRHPRMRLAVVEKEQGWAAHQSGRNSGVIHSGIYYAPGSLKARLARAGNRSMLELASRHGIPHRRGGKLIVATEASKLEALERLHERALENGIEVARLGPEQARRIEPHVACREALHVPSAAVIDYRRVCEVLARLVSDAGGTLLPGHRVESIRYDGKGVTLETSDDSISARFLLNCGGLHSDRLARLADADPGVRILPFRGEYLHLSRPSSDLVRTMIYTVPDLRLPFLGVHLTRGVDDAVHAGPNAVLALSREGYRAGKISGRDLGEMLLFPGLWRFLGRHWRTGIREATRSLSRRRFVESVRRLVPEIQPADLQRGSAGVRAQAVDREGRLVDDFVFVRSEGALHVCNAPSPAATAALEIAREIADRVDGSV